MTSVSLCTWNAGNGTKGDLERLMLRFHVIAGQEWGDREDLNEFARSKGWSVIKGDDKGSDSTPLLVDTQLVRIRRRVSILMLPSQDLGPGAGPSKVKNKYAVGGLLQVNKTIFGAVSTHLVASQQHYKRRKAAETHVKHLVRAFDKRHFPWFVMGDFNCTPEQNQLNPLYRARWTNTATKDHPLPTHGHRSIDYIWWEKAQGVLFQRQQTYATHSDHEALGASFRVS